jgi:hypothetical protein
MADFKPDTKLPFSALGLMSALTGPKLDAEQTAMRKVVLGLPGYLRAMLVRQAERGGQDYLLGRDVLSVLPAAGAGEPDTGDDTTEYADLQDTTRSDLA